MQILSISSSPSVTMVSLDTLNAHILAAISATNLFTEGRTAGLEEIRQVLEEVNRGE